GAGEVFRLSVQWQSAGAPSLPTGLFGPLDGRGPDADVRRQRIHAYEAAVNGLGADRVRVDLRDHQARADSRAYDVTHPGCCSLEAAHRMCSVRLISSGSGSALA